MGTVVTLPNFRKMHREVPDDLLEQLVEAAKVALADMLEDGHEWEEAAQDAFIAGYIECGVKALANEWGG